MTLLRTAESHSSRVNDASDQNESNQNDSYPTDNFGIIGLYGPLCIIGIHNVCVHYISS